MVTGEENEFTTWKYREKEGMVIHTIDYVFTSKKAVKIASDGA